MNSQAPSIPTYTIIHADGIYPDDKVEQEYFTPRDGSQDFKVDYIQTNLWPPDAPTGKPWSAIDKALRGRVDGITVLKMAFTADDLELFPRLKVIVRMGVGYDKLDRGALAKRGVTVCNIPDYGTCEIADHALALALSLRRGIILHHDLQRASPPADFLPITTPLISRLSTSTFGILGVGPIGSAVALRAKAFGWNVLFYDPYAPAGLDRSLGISRTKSLPDLFRRSTVLSIHCPLTAQTRGMVTYDLLRLLPRGAVLVNTARGEIVDLDGLERALREDIVSGVGLDVLPEEPIPDNDDDVHSLIRAYRNREQWLMGRMVLTPHSAWHCPESLEDVRWKTAETMRDVLIEGRATNVVPPQKE